MSDSYCVHLYSTRLALPLSLFAHTYIVTEHNDIRRRYELLHPKNPIQKTPVVGRVFVDAFVPEQGFRVYKSKSKQDTIPRWQPTLHGTCCGGIDSPAYKLYQFLESGGFNAYPYNQPQRYHMTWGPNSNTFTQWIVNQVPEARLTLPWNAWGKSFPIS